MRKILLLASAIAFTFSSCEKTMENKEGGWNSETVTVSSIAECDSLFKVTLTQAIPYSQSIYFTGDGNTVSVSDEELYERNLIKNAAVNAVVNGNQQFLLSYDEYNQEYVSTYIPNEGDKISISIETSLFGTAKSHEIIIPAKPSISLSSVSASEAPTPDSIVISIHLSIDDLPGRNYYRLLSRAIVCDTVVPNKGKLSSDSSLSEPELKTFYHINDAFTSNDDIFYDKSLSSGFGVWPAFFSNIFDDSIFDGSQYTFEINKTIPTTSVDNIRMYIKLQSLSKDLYYYLKSVQKYRITDKYSGHNTNDIYLHSNIENGWGILGGMSATRIAVGLDWRHPNSGGKGY